jgi:hypothetical protein
VPKKQRKRLNLLQIRDFGAILSILLLPIAAIGQTNAITFERLVYLTPSRDSFYHSPYASTFRVTETDPENGDANMVLPSGQIITLREPQGIEWRAGAAAAYGTHIAGIVFRVPSVLQLGLTFDSLHIPHGDFTPSRIENSVQLSFGIDSLEPLDISFISSDSVMPSRTLPLTDSIVQLGHYNRITWLVLTAGPNSEALLRRVFSALDLRQLHEGCCDYWLIGPPENRIAVRFAVPEGWPHPIPNQPTYEGNWLSIEEGGVIFAY